MKSLHRLAPKKSLLGFSLLSLFATHAFAIENAQSAFLTEGYQKQMQTRDMMNKLDANGDHLISREEFSNYYGKLFDMLDRDHDGTLDAKEWVGAAQSREMVSLSSGGYAREFASMQVMHSIDTDGDGKVSKEEFLKAHQTMFDRMDASHSGSVDSAHWLAQYFSK